MIGAEAFVEGRTPRSPFPFWHIEQTRASCDRLKKPTQKGRFLDCQSAVDLRGLDSNIR